MTLPEQLVDGMRPHVDAAIEIWIGGGWAMPAIAVVSLFMFGLAAHIWLRLLAGRARSVSERTWRVWIDHPEARRGHLGELLDAVMNDPSLDRIQAAFARLVHVELEPIRRDLTIMKVCVGAAPLLGLLGTVTGMLTTFGALASGSGGDETMAKIAAGISEALITTETGLVVALPGFLIHGVLTRSFERSRAFLAHVETVCLQTTWRRTHPKAA